MTICAHCQKQFFDADMATLQISWNPMIQDPASPIEPLTNSAGDMMLAVCNDCLSGVLNYFISPVSSSKLDGFLCNHHQEVVTRTLAGIEV